MDWKQTLSVHCNLVAPMITRAWQLPLLHISRFYSYSRMRESKVLPRIRRGSCRWPLTCYGSQTRHSVWALAAKCFTFRFQLFCSFGRLIMWSLFCSIFSYSEIEADNKYQSSPKKTYPNKNIIIDKKCQWLHHRDNSYWTDAPQALWPIDCSCFSSSTSSC